MEEDVKTLSDYLLIAWRRKFHILIPLLLVLAVTVPTVYLLPPVYKSTGTILIESQQIPTALIQSTVTSFANERIQIIKQRIMTSQQLLGIIKKFKLYKDKIKNTPSSQILQDMRGRIAIDQVSANVRRGGSKALIAFTVSFEHSSAATAQRVANELVTLFLDENIRSRTARAEETSDFLRKEGERLGDEITSMGDRIASYRQENANSLPETLSLKLTRVSNLKMALLSSAGDANALNERRTLLLIDLDALEKENKIPEAERITSNEQLYKKKELADLQRRYVSLSARYGPGHPDVKAIERQLDAFQKEYGNLDSAEDLLAQKVQIEEELLELTQKYSSEHPDVKKMQRRLDGVVSMIAEFDKPDSDSVDEKVEAQVKNEPSPLMLRTMAKLESIDNNITRIQAARQDLKAQIESLEQEISRIPQVERGLATLERDYENTRRKYQEIKSKQLQAELSQSLEQEQKGERFTLLEPPQRPDRPVKPDRPKLFMMGLALSIMSGLGVAGLAESLDGGIRGSRALGAVTQMTPLITIPYISVPRDVAKRKRRIKIMLIAIFVLGIAFVGAVHFFYKPLDLLWFIILRKLNLT